MTPKKVSIIIPCYNVEKYLEKCLESVATQTLKDIEIICVDDGSTDGTRKILELYAERYCNFSVIHKENGGLSNARNTGLRVASGEFVMFLDSDDFLTRMDALECLYKKALKDNLDQLFYSAEVFFENEEIKQENIRYIQYYKHNKKYPNVYNGKELFVILSENSDFKVNACMQLFKRIFLQKHNLRFSERIYHEDEVFTVQCITLAERVACLEEKLYGRRIRANSIMTAKNKKNSVLGYCHGMKILCDFAKENQLHEDIIFYKKFRKRLSILLSLASRLYWDMDSEQQKDIAECLDGEQRIWLEEGLDQRYRIDE